MATAAALPAWIDQVVDDLEAEFGTGTAQRGRAYADEGRVLQIVADRPGAALLAAVRGSGRARYQTLIRAERPGGELLWEARCSCPVGVDCKHAVAVLVVAARQRGAAAAPPPPRWESLLAPLAVPRPAAARLVSAGLLLQWPSNGALPAPGEPIELRPVRRGASGKWVKSDMSWRSLPYRDDLSGAAVQAFQAMGTMAATRRAGGQLYADTRVTLADLGGHAARLLSEAAAAGIELIAPDQRQRVVAAQAAAVPRFDTRRRPDGSISVTAAWHVAEEEWGGREVRLVGRPPTGLVAARGSEMLIASVPATDPALLALLEAGELTVPTQDSARFLTMYYPLLHRRAEVTSSDGSVPEPRLPTLRLRLDLTVEGGHRLGLRWGFSYGQGVDAMRFDLGDGPDPRQALRRADEERDLVGRTVALISPHVPQIVWPFGPSGHPQPYSPSGLVGMESAIFATRVLPALEEQDQIDVTVVGELPDYREVTDAPVVQLSVAEPADGGSDWFDLDVRVELGGEQVPMRPLFAALAAGDDQLLLDSGTWFDLDRPELHQLRVLIAEARALSDREGPLRLSRWQAGLWDELSDLGVVESQCAAWTEAVVGLLDPAGLAPKPPPEGLTASLRPYQREGYQWLAYLWEHRLGGILADDMGLGKTLQALAAIQRAREARETGAMTAAARGEADRHPVLVVAPTSVIGTWIGEAAKFAPELRVVALTETTARRGVDLAEIRADADVVVTSYALVRIEAEEYGAHEWAAVLLDEAQFVKNPRGRTHQVVRGLRAPVKIAMTGTPLENSLMDLWALLAITAPGLFPRPEVFTELYRQPIESGTDPAALTRLQRRLRPLLLRRTKERVAPELPPKQEQVVRVVLEPAHRRLYDRHLQRERARVLGMLDDFRKNRIAIFRSLTLLRQLALAPALIDPDGPGATVPSSKIEAFAEQIAAVVAEGHRALVFSQFTGFLALIRHRLDQDGIGYSYLDGRTRDRAARISDWRTGDAPVFLISLKAGGFGVTLTEADYVFVLDPWWNPAAEAQAVDRTHRIGQTKAVMVYRLIAADTIEEKVLALQERKRELFQRVVDDGGALDGVLTADDIRGLLSD